MAIAKSFKKMLYNRRQRSVTRTARSAGEGHSSDGQDIFIARRLLPDVERGVFVEIGANDGVTLSNTYYFEKTLGWNGLAIEPLPATYEKLVANRGCVTVHGCITEFDGETKFLEITGACEMLSGIPEKYDKGHAQRVQKNLRRGKATSREIVVPCFRIETLLNRHGFDHVHYMSVDTEGGELEILRSIDLAKLTIDVVSVENNSRGAEIEELMKNRGYRLVAIGGVDEIYVRRG